MTSQTPNPSTSRKSIHQYLGASTVADVMLWKNYKATGLILLGSTSMWFLFERAGYSLLSLFSNALLLLVVIMFFWAKSASLLNRYINFTICEISIYTVVIKGFDFVLVCEYIYIYRPLPPLPNLEVSDALVEKVADVAVVRINRVLEVARDITFKGDVKLFLKVASGLFIVSYVGSLFNFFTLVYIGVLLSLSVPVIYDKYQDQVDEKLSVAEKFVITYYRKLDENVISKIPLPQSKEKKSQ